MFQTKINFCAFSLLCIFAFVHFCFCLTRTRTCSFMFGCRLQLLRLFKAFYSLLRVSPFRFFCSDKLFKAKPEDLRSNQTQTFCLKPGTVWLLYQCILNLIKMTRLIRTCNFVLANFFSLVQHHN